MTGRRSRPFLAAMQITLDGHILGPDAHVDWVDARADGTPDPVLSTTLDEVS